MKNLKHTVTLNCEDDDFNEMTVSRSFEMSAIDILEGIENQGFDPLGMLETEGILSFDSDNEDDDISVWNLRKDLIVSGMVSILEEELTDLICNGFLYENFDVDNSWDASVESIEFEDEDSVIIEEFSNAIVSMFSNDGRQIIIA